MFRMFAMYSLRKQSDLRDSPYKTQQNQPIDTHFKLIYKYLYDSRKFRTKALFLKIKKFIFCSNLWQIEAM